MLQPKYSYNTLMAINTNKDFKGSPFKFRTFYGGVYISRGRWIRTTGLLHPCGFEARTQNPPGSSTLNVPIKKLNYITKKYSQKPYENKESNIDF